MAKFSGLNPKGPYLTLEKEKENFCVILTDSIKRAQSCNKAKKCTKKRDARAKLLFCQSKPIAFLLFSVAVAKLPTPCCCDTEILLPW